MTREGTYARERDGAAMLYHSGTRWNDASYGLADYLSRRRTGERISSLYVWRPVPLDEALAVEAEHGPIHPGEYLETTPMGGM